MPQSGVNLNLGLVLSASIVPLDYNLLINYVIYDYNSGGIKGFLLTVSKTDLFNPSEQ